jgi:hypothetical protein
VILVLALRGTPLQYYLFSPPSYLSFQYYLPSELTLISRFLKTGQPQVLKLLIWEEYSCC